MYKIEYYTGKNNFIKIIFFFLKMSIILNENAEQIFVAYFQHFKTHFKS